MEPQKYLQLGFYEYARALFHTDAGVRTAIEAQALSFEEIHRLTDFSEEALKGFIGLPDIDPAAITLAVFHTHAPGFAARYPKRFMALADYFQLPPLTAR
ncbi:hypothetical protein E4021_15345 [Neolewinella litorea]|uniref:Uncharacterized protein n=1 Tax=Neolewinella litorea TaxID=2562452 RepID=A0A4S4NAT3_9BACT|nr:hypothetical protein E4021_15345 [Neolewinella litorea]